MRRAGRVVSAFTVAVIAGCASQEEAPPPTVPPPPPCPIQASWDWTWALAASGRGGTRLSVAGVVSLPQTGWTTSWEHPRAHDGRPTRVAIELRAVRDGGETPPVVQRVRGSWTASRPIESVAITCRERTLVVMVSPAP